MYSKLKKLFCKDESNLLEVAVVVEGTRLPIYRDDEARVYVDAQPGKEFALRITNLTSRASSSSTR